MQKENRKYKEGLQGIQGRIWEYKEGLGNTRRVSKYKVGLGNTCKY